MLWARGGVLFLYYSQVYLYNVRGCFGVRPLVRESTCPRFQLLELGLGLDILILGQVDPRTTDYEPLFPRASIGQLLTPLFLSLYSS